MSHRVTVIRYDESTGDLFEGSLNEYDVENYCILDAKDAAVWDEYIAACKALGKAREKVRNSLRMPYRAEMLKVAK